MKNKKLFYKRFLLVFLGLFVLIGSSEVRADYMYSSSGQIIMASDGFTTSQENIYGILSTSWSQMLVDNADFGNASAVFNSPTDMTLFKDSNGVETIYITDSSSNRLFVFDGFLNYKETIKQFEIDITRLPANQLQTISTYDATNKVSVKLFPNGEYDSSKRVNCFELAGVYRALRPAKNADGTNMLDPDTQETIYEDIIYLCDSKNKQVLLLDATTYKIVQVVTMPSSLSFADKFQPSKMVIDTTGRMYIISTNIYEGILLVSYQGNFMRMVGVNYTTLSVWDALRRNFRTEEQLASETTILQTSFNNLAIDSKNFIYTVSGPITNPDGTKTTDKMIKRINQANVDVLKRTGYTAPQGDLIYARTGSNAGSSNFTGIAVNEYGIYTVIDSRNGRLFTYNDAGDLLYISAGSGEQVTDVKIPVAVLYQGENLLILDKSSKCVMRFVPTEFATKVNQAVQYEFQGLSEEASKVWQEVITLNPQYELAYVGVGKRLYDEGRYQEAMLYYQKGANVKYFSKAYKMHRDEIIKEYFPAVTLIIAALLITRFTFKTIKKRKNMNPYEDGDLV